MLSLWIVTAALTSSCGGPGTQRAVEHLLRPCTIEGVNKELRCGTLEVFENREKKSGRKIPLNVVVLPATGGDRLPDALFHLEGGPGVAATGAAAFYAERLPVADLRRRDIVLVDLRGTGKSAPLRCRRAMRALPGASPPAVCD